MTDEQLKAAVIEACRAQIGTDCAAPDCKCLASPRAMRFALVAAAAANYIETKQPGSDMLADAVRQVLDDAERVAP